MRDEFQKIEIPEELDQIVNRSMNQIYKEQRRKRIRKMMISTSATAAVLAGGVFFCASYPTLAANLPFIGHIFEKMQDSFSYEGDYSQIGEALEPESVAQQLESAENPSEMEEISAYTKTSGGLTVTLSEVYCNEQALYITTQLKAEEPFPEVYTFQLDTSEQYSFNPTMQMDIPSIEGDFIDEYTYAGVIRFDLNKKRTDMSAYDVAREKALAAGEEWDDNWDAYGENENWKKYVKTVEIPDHFTLDLKITQIHGPLKNPDKPDFGKTAEELDAMSEDEWHAYMTSWYQEHPDWNEIPNEHQDKIYNGSWDFTIEVDKNTEDTQIVEVNDVNDLGIGIEKVVKDRFEITMYDTYADDAYGADYFPVMLDADGILMDYGSSGSVNTVAINDRDVSRVDIFLVDYYKWMDELKGDKWRQPGALTEDGRTYRELLLEESAYHTEVVFEQ